MNLRLRAEIDDLQQKLRGLKEELAEREGQLRVAKMNLQTAQKQSVHHSHEVGSPARDRTASPHGT